MRNAECRMQHCAGAPLHCERRRVTSVDRAPQRRSPFCNLHSAFTIRHSSLVILLLLAGLAGCDRGRGATQSPDAARAIATEPPPLDPALPKPDVNVVIYLIDTLRADRLGAYGYEKPTSPNLDALARDGVLFENADAPAPWTLPSVPSIKTSTFLCEHGIVVEGQRLSPGIWTLAERLKRVGYHTASLYVNDFAGPLTGMDRGYDICRKFRAYIEPQDVERWLAERPADQPFLLYIHTIEPHNPFNASLSRARRFGNVSQFQNERMMRLLSYYRRVLRVDWTQRREIGRTDNTALQDTILQNLHQLLDQHNALYDATIHEADERVGATIEALRRHGLWENTLFIVLSDHGEEFAERGAYLHSQSVYQELAAVPLIVRFPHNQHAGKRVSTVVSLIDVLPTIFDTLGRPDLTYGARGRSLMPLVTGDEDPGRTPLAVTIMRDNRKKYYRPWAESRGDRNLSVRSTDGQWKGIWNLDLNTFELYDLFSDPGEGNNVAAEHPNLIEAMIAHARPWYEQCLASAPPVEEVALKGIDPETLRNLAALGYIDMPGEEEDDEAERREIERLLRERGPSGP